MDPVKLNIELIKKNACNIYTDQMNLYPEYTKDIINHKLIRIYAPIENCKGHEKIIHKQEMQVISK